MTLVKTQNIKDNTLHTHYRFMLCTSLILLLICTSALRDKIRADRVKVVPVELAKDSFIYFYPSMTRILLIL